MTIATRARVLPVHYATKLKASFLPDLAAPLPASLPCDIGGPLVVTDTANSLSQSGAALVCAAGTGAWGDPGVWGPAIVRSCGLALIGTLTVTDATQAVEFGFDSAQAGALGVNAFRVTADTLVLYNAGAAGPNVGVPTDGTAYQLCIVLAETAGALYLIKGGIYTNWTTMYRAVT